jgi:acyl-CoA thioesterase
MTSGEKSIAVKCRDEMWKDDSASQHLGMQVDVSEPGKAMASFTVRDTMVNGHGVCHGGYIFTLADSAFAFSCNTYNVVTFASSAAIEFVRPARAGDDLSAVAEERHRGGRTGIYDVTVTNQGGEVVAIFRGRSHATRDAIL